MGNVFFVDSKTGIQFVKSKNPVPTSSKKLRGHPEVRDLYAFIYEHDLQHEAFDSLNRCLKSRR